MNGGWGGIDALVKASDCCDVVEMRRWECVPVGL